MSEKRFVYGRAFPINSDNSLPCITDRQDEKDYVRMNDLVDLLNELFDENGKLKEETSYLFQELNQRIVKNNKLRKQIQEQKDKINQLEEELKEKEKENEYIMELREDFNLDKYIEMRKLLEKYQQDEFERNQRF